MVQCFNHNGKPSSLFIDLPLQLGAADGALNSSVDCGGILARFSVERADGKMEDRKMADRKMEDRKMADRKNQDGKMECLDSFCPPFFCLPFFCPPFFCLPFFCPISQLKTVLKCPRNQQRNSRHHQPRRVGAGDQ
jgi:hypothetical protein